MTSKKRDQKRVFLVAVRDNDPSETILVKLFSFPTEEEQKAFAGEAERKGFRTIASEAWRQVHGASVADTSREEREREEAP